MAVVGLTEVAIRSLAVARRRYRSGPDIRWAAADGGAKKKIGSNGGGGWTGGAVVKQLPPGRRTRGWRSEKEDGASW